MCGICFGRRVFDVKNPKQRDGYTFTVHTTCIPWCMQPLRFVHTLHNLIGWHHGLHGWNRGTSHMFNSHEPIRFPGRQGPQVSKFGLLAQLAPHTIT